MKPLEDLSVLNALTVRERLRNVFFNYFETFGDGKSEYHGEVGDGIPLKYITSVPCYFCGDHNGIIVNTHSPSYWIKCTCGLELNGHHISDDGNTYADIEFELGDNDRNKIAVQEIHFRAFCYILDKWEQGSRFAIPIR